MKNLFILIGIFACVLLGCQNCSTEVSQAQVLEDILQNRRSIRQYSDQQVSDEMLLKILWAANG
ncbi:MAG: nitroreductase family protein, partial [Bacteroidaceae bacterium]|nr:nitroreductase family protein [Bacteroidaceae bacterium]